MHAVIPVIKGRLADYDVTWTPQLVFNGAMPSTLIPSPGTEVSGTTWVGSAELHHMNATEGQSPRVLVPHWSARALRPALTTTGRAAELAGRQGDRGRSLFTFRDG